MADHTGPQGRNTPSPSPGRRQRAPTITIDTSAVSSRNNMGLSDHVDGVSDEQPSSQGINDAPAPPQHGSPIELRAANSFESRESRPTSPHNISSPTSKWGGEHNFLAVPGNARSRGNSLDSTTEVGASTTSSAGDTYVNTLSPTSQGGKSKPTGETQEVLGDDVALQPDPGTEADFEVEDNKFAFSPGQLMKMYNPKSLGAFHAIGGLAGLEKGLRTDRKAGLSMDETTLDGEVTFEEARAAASSPTRQEKQGLTRRETTASTKAQSDMSYTDRKRVFSDNRLPERKAKNIFQLAWIAYNDKVLILLTIAAVISLALGIYEAVGTPHNNGEPPVEWVEGVAIVVAIVIVVVVGALNDWQKERQFVKLNKKKDDRLVKAIRNGRTREIGVHDVLVGDVLLLEPGDMVPVDGIFIEGHNLKCDESSATGESDLLKKTPADEVWQALEAGQGVRKMDPFILSGAKISEGVGSFLVTATGVYSSYGKTMMALREDNEVTPLQSKLNVLAEYIAKLGGAAALLLFVVLLIEFLAKLPHNGSTPAEKGQEFLSILIVAITVVVVAVPEGLPLAVTLALAFATTRMLKENNLVRVLRSCETMGNATTICSDKTGTLTQNKMSVVAGTMGTALRFGDRKMKSNNASNAESPESPKGKEPGNSEAGGDISASEFVKTLDQEVTTLLEQSIAINSTAFEGEEDGRPAFVGSKTETALLNFAQAHLGMGSVSEERSNANLVQLVPFDSGRKCMAAIVKLGNGSYRMYIKGASEILLSRCARIIADPTRGTDSTTLTSEARQTLSNLISAYASRSLRTIGLSYRDFQQWPPQGTQQAEDPSQADFDKIFKDTVFLGVVGIQDPLRDAVPKAVQDCQRAGVFVRMVTGDNVLTAKAIAEECGILVPGGLVMEGPTFRKLSKLEMNRVIPKLCVLARSSPEDKRILVKRLKELGETVAVTGDGTNDAPALKAADIGFSMGIAGTEVAKEASAIIIMDDNFASIVKALLWGRAVNDAVRKFLQFQLTVNITAVLLTFVSAVASSDQTSVLSAVQLLWVNLIMDTFAALALATDPPTQSLLDRKPDPKSAPLISVTMWKMIIGQAIYQLIVTFVLYFGGKQIFSYDSVREMDQLGTLVFNTFVWMQIFNEVNNRRLDNHFNIFEGIHKNYFFIGINCIMIGGQIMIVFVGGAAFSVKPLNGAQWGYSIVLGFLSIPVGVIIRCIPDELIVALIPGYFKRKRTPDIEVTDDHGWNQGIMEIREELAFIKKVRGGRLGALKFKIQHPVQALGFSKSSERLASSSHSLPRTPNNEPSDNEASSFHTPGTPESRPRRSRGRSRSNSAFGPAAAMAGIVAGSIAGWSPIERRDGDNDSIRFGRDRSKSDLESQPGLQIHPDTKPDDPVVVDDVAQKDAPPSQLKETTPDFKVGPFAGDPKLDNSKKKDDTEP